MRAQTSSGNSAIKRQIRKALNHKTSTAGKTKEMVIGYAPGAYDLFHVGHLNILTDVTYLFDQEHFSYFLTGFSQRLGSKSLNFPS